MEPEPTPTPNGVLSKLTSKKLGAWGLALVALYSLGSELARTPTPETIPLVRLVILGIVAGSALTITAQLIQDLVKLWLERHPKPSE